MYENSYCFVVLSCYLYSMVDDDVLISLPLTELLSSNRKTDGYRERMTHTHTHAQAFKWPLLLYVCLGAPQLNVRVCYVETLM